MKTINGSDFPGFFDAPKAKELAGQTVELCACVHKVRQMSGFAFVVLRTGRYIVQSVYSPDSCPDSMEGIREGCYVRVSGEVKPDERANHGFELLLSSIALLSQPAAEYPLKVSARKLGCSLDVNLDNRSVALRNPYERAVFKLQEGIVSGFREYMLQENFTEIHSPKIVAAGAEGGANIFHLDYFDRQAYLAQSPQFYKQTAVAFFDRVFEIAPVYRAERHSTSRHLNEYIGLDFEMGFIQGMDDVMQVETGMLRHVMAHLNAHYQGELKILGVTLPEVGNIPSVTFVEALDILRGEGSGRNRFDLDPADEVRLCEYAKKEFDSEFIFVTHFPTAKRPFYAMDDPSDPRAALSFDLLFRGLEITTGGQRIHDYNEQVAKMERMGLNPAEFESYLAIHKYGMPPHGGLGIGLERLLMKLLDLQNVRQASLFPRDMNRLEP